MANQILPSQPQQALPQAIFSNPSQIQPGALERVPSAKKEMQVIKLKRSNKGSPVGSDDGKQRI